MLTLTHKAPAGATAAGRVVLTHAERQRVRWRTRLASGEDVGIMLPRGTVLGDGDLLQADDGTVIAVVAAAETLIEVASVDPQALARAAYHLGNRHASVEIGPHWLRTPGDRVLADMLRSLGFAARELTAPFHPEPGAYAAGGHAHSSEARHAGVIHDFMPASRADRS